MSAATFLDPAGGMGMQFDREAVKAAMREVLDERLGIDNETHQVDHVYIGYLRERDRRRKERFDRVSSHVLGWAIVAAIIGLVSALGAAAKQALWNLIHTKGGP